MEGKRFAGKSDDAFHEHEMDAGVTNGNDIAAVWRMGDICEAVDKMDAMVAVGGEHADTFDPNGEQYEAEDNGARGYKDNDPNHRKGWITSYDCPLQPGRGCRIRSTVSHRRHLC